MRLQPVYLAWAKVLVLGLSTLVPNSSASAEKGAKQFKTSKGYVHSWVALPALTGTNPVTGQSMTFQPRKGRMTVVVFIASWCVPCQLLAPDLKNLESRYAALDADFVYVFSHDTQEDARGFAKEYKLGDYVILGNDQILKDYHTPPLPTFYFADRHGWLTARELKMEKEKLATLDELLSLASLM